MDRIGIEPHFIELIGKTLYIMRMRMPDGDDGMAAIQVQVLLTVLVPDIGPFGFRDRNVVDRINVEEVHNSRFRMRLLLDVIRSFRPARIAGSYSERLVRMPLSAGCRSRNGRLAVSPAFPIGSCICSYLRLASGK